MNINCICFSILFSIYFFLFFTETISRDNVSDGPKQFLSTTTTDNFSPYAKYNNIDPNKDCTECPITFSLESLSSEKQADVNKGNIFVSKQ